MKDRLRPKAGFPLRRRIDRRIGILGGSFNPAHEGHRHISVLALKAISLDEVWWLVSPGNPLKDPSKLAPLTSRVEAAIKVSAHPRIRIKTFEADRHLTYTVDTIDALQSAFPATGFVWLMGADNLMSFHHWERWHAIARSIPIAIFSRPGYGTKVLRSRFAQYYQRYRVEPSDAPLLPAARAPIWTYLPGRTVDLSSTRIRQMLPNVRE